MKKFIESWERTKSKGRIQYALIQGFIFGVVVTLIKDRQIIWELFNGYGDRLNIIVIDFIWLFIGATIGYITIVWWWKNKIYKNEKLAATKDLK